MFKLRLLAAILLFSIFYFSEAPGSHLGRLAWAQEEFDVSFNTSYVVGADGTAQVQQKVRLTNRLSQVYATSYSLVVEGKTPEEVGVTQDGKSLPSEVSRENGRTKITVSFPDALVGKDKTREFIVQYRLTRFAIQNGQVWELAIPKLASSETIDSYFLSLSVPKSFGDPAYISPSARSKSATSAYQNFFFQKEDLTRAGIVAAFGEFQVFSFDLSYHLENPFSKPAQTEVALPPDTAFQRVYYEKIDPAPKNVWLDDDGNWLATFKLGPKERLGVKAQGAVQIFAKPQDFYPKINPDDKNHYLSSSPFWQVEDPEIKELARKLATPAAIYDFLIWNLRYDYSRVEEGVVRLGAKEALSNPGAAICMEFTDLFVALSRAAGIPAREVNGFAYTENPEIQPLSLVADVLHAWPEYWDERAGIWRPVDPTWGNTTGGVDFFNKFDLSHFTFAIHGKDASEPYPAGSYKSGTNPQKDVQVAFGSLPAGRQRLEFDASLGQPILPWRPVSLFLSVKNQGTTALYNQEINIQGAGVAVGRQKSNIDFLAPKGTEVVELAVRVPLLPLSSERSISVLIADQEYVYNIPKLKIFALQALVVFTGILLPVGVTYGIFWLKNKQPPQ